MSDYLLAAYTLDGEFVGWATRIHSIVTSPPRAERFADRAAAERRIPALEHAWRGYQYWYVVERAPPPVVAVDSQPNMAVPSSVPAPPPTQRKGGEVSTKQKQTAPKPTKSKPSTKPSSTKPTKLLPDKPVMRTTAAKANGAREPNGLCICGCGEEASAYLKRGHYTKLCSKLEAIARGELDSIKAFGKKLAAAWGPWVASNLGGVRPQFAKSGKGLLEYWKGR